MEELVLPPGKVDLDPEAVLASQRRRLFLALALVAEERGFEVASVEQIAARARLSKTTLYELYGSREGLLEAAVEEFCEPAAAAVREALARVGPWREAVRAGFEALAGEVARDPALARLAFVEGALLSEGASGASRCEHILALIFDRAAAGAGFPLARGELATEALPDPAAATRRATLGGLQAPIADRLMRGCSAEVAELVPGLTHLVVNAHDTGSGGVEGPAA